MRVSKIQLRNVAGLREFDLDVTGKITLIEGANGTGKTSVLNGLKCLVGGGNLASIRNLDAPEDEPAEGVLELLPEDGDENGKLLIRKLNKALTVKEQVGESAAFEKREPPQRFLDALSDAQSANPVQFITCKDSERIGLLLEALPLSHDSDEMWKAIGLQKDEVGPVPKLDHPLREIAHVKDMIFSKRTGINSTERAKRSTVHQLRLKIPAEQPTIEDVQAKQDELDALRESISAREHAAETERKSKSESAKNQYSEYTHQLESEYKEYESELIWEMNRKLRAFREEQDKKSDEMKSAMDGSIEAAQDYYSVAIGETQAEREKAEQLAVEIATARAHSDDAIRIQTIRDQADEQEAEADSCKALSERFTAALAALETYKANLCKDLPIDGLDLSDGDVKVHGVPWEKLNTAKRNEIAVMVSILRFKDKPFRPVFIDGAEDLDEENLAAMIASLKKAGAEAFLTRVTNGPLSARSV